MYELKRAKKLTEQVKIGEDIITVNLDLVAISKEYTKRQNAVIAAEQTLKANSGTVSQEAYGNAVIAILNLIFGDENTDKILTFYENDYTEMMTEVFPFIINVVAPAVNDEKERIANLYKKGAK